MQVIFAYSFVWFDLFLLADLQLLLKILTKQKQLRQRPHLQVGKTFPSHFKISLSSLFFRVKRFISSTKIIAAISIITNSLLKTF